MKKILGALGLFEPNLFFWGNINGSKVEGEKWGTCLGHYGRNIMFWNENTKVITSVEGEREYGILAHSANQLSILAKKVLLEMPLCMDYISLDFRDKPYLNFSFLLLCCLPPFITCKQENTS